MAHNRYFCVLADVPDEGGAAAGYDEVDVLQGGHLATKAFSDYRRDAFHRKRLSHVTWCMDNSLATSSREDTRVMADAGSGGEHGVLSMADRMTSARSLQVCSASLPPFTPNCYWRHIRDQQHYRIQPSNNTTPP